METLKNLIEDGSEFLEYNSTYPMIVAVAAIIISYVVNVLMKQFRSDTQQEQSPRRLIFQALRRPIVLSILTYGMYQILHAFDEDTHDTDSPEGILTSLMITIVMTIWAGALFRITSIVLHLLSHHSTNHSVIQPRTLPVFDILAKTTVIAVSIYFIFLTWDVDLTAWMASAGIAGIALSFAAKDSLANLFAGIFLAADAPYQVGDYILLENQLRGEVTRIGIRSIRVLTRDDIEVVVPNAIIGNAHIINETGGPYVKQRLRIPISVAYGSDIDLVRKALLEAAKEIHYACRTPVPQVFFMGFGASGLEHELLFWIQDAADKEPAVDVANCCIYKSFTKHEIEIPYSKHDIYIKQFQSIPSPISTPNMPKLQKIMDQSINQQSENISEDIIEEPETA